MSNERFGEFVLEGSIFEEEGMPVEAASELIAYKALVLDVAKQLYLRKNPHRERSPKNLATEFDLRLVKITQGSADLLLVVPATQQAAQTSLLPEYDPAGILAEGRDAVLVAIDAVSRKNLLPSSFPRKSLTKFRGLGKSLPKGHSIRLADPTGTHRTRMTPGVRERFLVLLDADATPVKQEAAGTIVELDPERTTFHLRTSDGDRIPCVYGNSVARIDPSILTDEDGNGPLVSVRGTALVGRDGQLQQFTHVESVDQMMPPHQQELLDRVVHLLELDDGWLGPDSLGPLQSVRESTIELLQQLQVVPANMAAAPLPDGGLRFEWSSGAVEYIAEVEADGGLYLCTLPEASSDDADKQYEKVNAEAFVRFVEDGELD